MKKQDLINLIRKGEETDIVRKCLDALMSEDSIFMVSLHEFERDKIVEVLKKRKERLKDQAILGFNELLEAFDNETDEFIHIVKVATDSGTYVVYFKFGFSKVIGMFMNKSVNKAKLLLLQEEYLRKGLKLENLWEQ